MDRGSKFHARVGCGAAPELRVENLSVRFADRGKSFTALDIHALEAAPGARLALTGPSGCGKSTLLYVLAGLIRPANGAVRWGGEDIFAMGESARDAWRRRNVGFVFQDFELLPELPALENVLVPATFARFSIGAELRARARSLLDQFGVPARAGPAGFLSRGERQRVALARALLFDPPVLLADEPTASLDAASGAIVIDALARRAREDGRTVIAATHDFALIERMGSRLALEHGRAAAPAEAAP